MDDFAERVSEMLRSPVKLSAADRLTLAEVQIKTAIAALQDGDRVAARMLLDDALAHVRGCRE